MAKDKLIEANHLRCDAAIEVETLVSSLLKTLLKRLVQMVDSTISRQ